MLHNSFKKLIGFSLRIINKNRFYSWVIVMTFAVGIGACTVAYSLFESILHAPLPFDDAEKLVIIKSFKDGNEGSISLSDMQTIQERISGFEDVAAYWPGVQYNVSGDADKLPEEVATTLCTSNLFKVLGVPLQLGEMWPQDFDQTVSYGTVMTNSLWERRYNKDLQKVGGSMTLDTNGQYGMYGVLPEGFRFPFEAELFRSMIIGQAQLTNRSYRNVIGVARLSAGTDLKQTRAALSELSLAMQTEFKDSNEGLKYQISPITEMYLGKISPYLTMIAIAVACVFLLVCVNVGSLLLSIAHQRSKEIAIRRLVGGRFSTIISQYLAQNLLLAITGGALGLLLSYWSVAGIESTIAKELPFWVSLKLNTNALGLAILLSILAGLLTAIVPALKSARINSHFLISPTTRSLGFNQRIKDILVTVQMALGTCLVIVASVIIQDLIRLQQEELGFEKDRLSVFEVAVPFDKYKFDFDAVNAFYTSSLQTFSRMPGVQSVALTDNLPLAHEEEITAKTSISLEGQLKDDTFLNPTVIQQKVSPEYHQTMGIQLISGRAFQNDDLKETLPVCIISSDLAGRLWPSEAALGKRLKIGSPENNNKFMTVVGVSENVKHSSLTSQASYDLYVPMVQTVAYDAFFVVKTLADNPDGLENSIAGLMESIDPDQSVFGFTSMDQVVSKRLWKQHISGSVFSIFGSIAFLIALIGIYAVVNHSVSTQLKQLSIRRVLGASARQITLLMVGKTFLLAILGVIMGVLLTAGLRGPVSEVIPDMSVLRHLNTTWYLTAFIAISILAGIVPVRRMLKLNPANILRSE